MESSGWGGFGLFAPSDLAGLFYAAALVERSSGGPSQSALAPPVAPRDATR
ncbi:MAG TPA: hypothetical protein VMS17_31235 [Gemmataceae bacterium]|nr:hypothetical protein [Gemmataceae bacterium]